MSKNTLCPICGEIIGSCGHNRADMVLTILDEWDRISKKTLRVKLEDISHD